MFNSIFCRKPLRRKATLGYAIFVFAGILGIILGANILIKAPIAPMFLIIWLFIYPATMMLGYTFEEVNAAMMDSCRNGLGAVLIILAVGAMIATWIAAGTVPALIYYGLMFINPQYFLLSAFVLCSMVSLACGTSWGTMGTAGIAMFGVGASLGIPPGVTLGAIISGSYLGDMLSPMSDSTNVAAAATGVDLIYHCKQLAIIVLPISCLTGILFMVIGMQYSVDTFEASFIGEIMSALSAKFSLGFVAFIPMIVLLAMLMAKMPAMYSMLFSAVVGATVAAMYQGLPADQTVQVFWNGYVSDTGHKFIDSLLNRGGVRSMFNPACMMLFAFGMVGAFNTVGILDAVVNPIIKRVKTVAQLSAISQVISIIGNTLGTNTFSLLMTGTLMTPAYHKYGLHPVNLGKSLNSTSTVICPYIPWNASGIFVAGMFSVPIANWAPYALFSYLMPIAAFLFVLFNFRVIPADPVLVPQPTGGASTETATGSELESGRVAASQ